MSSSHPNDKNLQVDLRRRRRAPSPFEHPEYDYWIDEWRTIRDCLLGEVEIKRQTTKYLPRLEGQEDDEYCSYLERGTFYNMCSRTVNGLVGTVFRREPKVHNLPKKFEQSTKTITKDNMSLNIFAKQITQEIITLGRYGVLLDMDVNGKNAPFFAGYVAENIIDWKVEDIDGRYTLTEVVLREIVDNRPRTGSTTTPSKNYLAAYRVLKLVDGEYQQHFYPASDGDADLSQPADRENIVTPTNRGKPFDFIPFIFFGPWTNSPDVEKSPLLDIALLNLSHYRSYSQLEHGRFYTALPVFTVPVLDGDEGGEYFVGPNRVWEYDGSMSARPNILEYNGHGLIFLEKALDQKEQQVSNIGGRMLGVRGTAVAESDNLVKLREKNEQSLLLNVTTTVNEGVSTLLQWWLAWQDTDVDDIRIELNQDFLFDTLRAREFRAITMMYQEGILPIDVIYEVMRKAEIIPEYLELEEFKKLLDNDEQFPNQADVLARMRGFPDAEAELEQNNLVREARQTRMTRAIDRQNEVVVEEEEENEDGTDAAPPRQRDARPPRR